MASLGSEDSTHGAHWHGLTGLSAGHRTDSLVLVAGGTETLDTEARAPPGAAP